MDVKLYFCSITVFGEVVVMHPNHPHHLVFVLPFFFYIVLMFCDLERLNKDCKLETSLEPYVL